MKRAFFFAVLVVFLIMVTACVGGNGSKEMTFFLLSEKPPAEYPDAKKIGCDNYLVPVKQKIPGEVKLPVPLRALFEADLSKYPGLFTATALQDKYIVIDKMIEPEDKSSSTPLRVYLKTMPDGGIAGVCDVSRIKEQVTETIRAYADKRPFEIYLNGKMREWECLGDESGLCK